MIIRGLLFLAVAFFASAAFASDRIALVVGVNEYDNAPHLANPVRDAKAVAGALAAVGFDVQTSIDPDQGTLGQAVLEFVERSEGAQAAVFYFAGHGIQINSKNYLLSKSAKVTNPLLIDQDGFEVSKILELISANAATTIAIVDACRDNPMAEELNAASAPSTRSAWGLSRGLAPLDGNYPNSLVAFATLPGHVAFDGVGEHSPFTSALLEHITAPGLEVSIMLKRVIRDVLQKTQGNQRPEIVASMADEFYFHQPTLNIEGDLVVAQPESEEATATELLRIALDLTEEDKRAASLGFIVDRYEGTAAAAFAEHFLESFEEALASEINSAPKESPRTAEGPAPSFDTARLDGLDVDRLKREAEDALSSKPTPAETEVALGLSDTDVTRVQAALNSLGYNLGTADGAFGPRSRRALRSFQVASALPETGFLDGPTIDALLKTVAETPKTYEGNWQLVIYREWLDNDRNHAPNVKGSREVLASAKLSARNNRFYVQSFHYRTIEPADAFTDFEATYSDSGRVRLSGGVSTHFRDATFVVPNMRDISASLQLPELVPYRGRVEAGANRIDSHLKFHVELTRVK